MIAERKQRKTPLLDNEVRQAIELLDRAGKILTSISGGNEVEIEPNFFFVYTLDAYDLHGRLSETASKQLLLVKSFAASKACNPNYLLHISLHATQGSQSNPEVATFALNDALSGILASSAPDYQAVALIIRKLVGMCGIHKGDTDEDVVYEMYKQAYRIMVGLKPEEYPTEEGKWLAMTAWNRAALPVRLGRVESARKWMTVGLELAGKVEGMDIYKSCMEDFRAGFEKKFDGENRSQV